MLEIASNHKGWSTSNTDDTMIILNYKNELKKSIILNQMCDHCFLTKIYY